MRTRLLGSSEREWNRGNERHVRPKITVGRTFKNSFCFFLIGIREGQFRQKKRLDREVDTGSRGLCV